MNKGRNLDKAFQEFLKRLRVSEQDRKVLLEARRIVRRHFRDKFAEIKFLTQGSWAYHMMINPTQCPPQQMDLDDGAYFCEPRILVENPKTLFRAVDPLLEEIAKEHSWGVDTSKVSCGRLIIERDKHIDIPLYRVVGDNLRNGQNGELVDLYRKAGIPYYPASEQVLLAQRTGEWVISDPRVILEWVLYCEGKYGQQFLRLCCYFKAWRDHQWAKPSMKSILIMAMIASALEHISELSGEADDAYATYKCVMHMTQQLGLGGIKDPSDSDKILDGDLDLSERHDMVERLRRLGDALEKCLHDSALNADDLCKLLRDQFGKFFPCDPSLLENCRPVHNVGPAIITPTVVPTPRPWSE